MKAAEYYISKYDFRVIVFNKGASKLHFRIIIIVNYPSKFLIFIYMCIYGKYILLYVKIIDLINI